MKAVVWVVKNAYEAGEFETKIGAHVNIIGDIRRYDGNLNSEIDNYVTYTGPLDEPPNAKFFVNANKEAAGGYDLFVYVSHSGAKGRASAIGDVCNENGERFNVNLGYGPNECQKYGSELECRPANRITLTAEVCFKY